MFSANQDIVDQLMMMTCTHLFFLERVGKSKCNEADVITFLSVYTAGHECLGEVLVHPIF